jgi:hypothetical protein
VFLQERHVGDVGGAEHIAMRRMILDVERQPLKRDLAGGSNDIDRHPGVQCGEGASE